MKKILKKNNRLAYNQKSWFKFDNFFYLKT